ncbi:MAG: hypothetical protein U0804_22930 [Gemmataceae bacterium]
MTISRYKIMAGILGVSLGGLAVAGQCSRPDTPHRSNDTPPADPKVPSAGTKPAPLPAVPAPPAVLPLPTLPSPATVDLPALPLPTSAPSKLPELPVVPPVKVEAPRPVSVPTPVVIPASGTTLPDVTPALPATPPVAPMTPKAAQLPAVEPLTPSVPTTALIPAPPATVATPPAAVPPTPSVEPAPPRPAPAAVAQVPQQQAVAAANRFRILLRVGEGEPMFEVKSGDDLVLRVVCEKVDVKSPEKGQGPSSVVATGKVRFVGFGAEGTCESLSFQAGSGEVAMTGAVRVQVKDRIGRVESELTSDRLQYRLDANALPGTLRP